MAHRGPMRGTRIVTTVGLEMPLDFPTGLYNSIHSRLHAARGQRQSFWRDYAPSWNAVAYRYRACADLAEEFSQSVNQHGDGPAQPERYLQDRALFGFFVNALSTLEALAFALYAIGHTVRAGAFRLTTERHRRNVSPERTAAVFAKAFPTDPLAQALVATLSSPERRTLEKVRNVLAHRGQPGRRMFLSTGTSTQQPAGWIRGLTIHPSMVERKRLWLARRLRVIMSTTDRFVSANL
jgi:hypothetical protein